METPVASSGLRPFASMPPMPQARPLVGHMPMIRNDRMTFLRLAAESPHPLLRIEAPLGNVAIITVPELLHEVLVERHADYVKSAMMRFSLGPIANEGLFTSSGELWRRQRKLMAPLFHQGALKTYADDMILCARRAVDGWRDGERIEFAKEATRITMAIAGRTLFDADTHEDTERLGDAITVALDWGADAAGGPYSLAHIVPSFALTRAADHLPAQLADPARALSAKLEKPLFFPGAEGKKLREALDVLEGRVREMIALRRAQGFSRPDLLSKLLAAKDDETGAGMSDQQVRDEVLILFLAGHETTALAISWTFHLLSQHPKVEAALVDELNTVLAGRDPTFEDLPRLKYAERVVHESLRLYPPAWSLGREALAPFEMGGQRFEKGAWIWVLPWTMHRDPRFYPDPLAFRPERWEDGFAKKLPRGAYIPFGAGPRVCIGNQFAMMESVLLLATIAQRFSLRAAPSPAVIPEPAITLRFKHGIKARLARRPSPATA